MEENYYSLLEITQTATSDEIKKSYRRLALKWHPDANSETNAADKFSAINRAYETLSDDNKRREYDLSFGKGSVYSPDGGFTPSPRQGSDVVANVVIDIKDLYKKQPIVINYKRQSPCDACQGSKKQSGKPLKKCMLCNGKKGIERVVDMGFGRSFRQMTICPNCEGAGVVVPPESFCLKCSGKGYQETDFSKTLTISGGNPDGNGIHMPYDGNLGFYGGPPGDLYINFRVNNNTPFQLNGPNLVLNKELPYHMICLGGEFKVTLPNDQTVTMAVPKLFQMDKKLRAVGKGLPIDENRSGDLLVQISIKIPKTLSEKEVKILKEMENIV